jgi:MerR family transcriptional regulator, light-induced transcriptional regulator
MSASRPTQWFPQLPDPAQPTFRSGAVARIAGMPVATLRVWEQRYRAVQPATTASGHRQYSAADVERVTLLRRLTEQGHSIGLLAALDTGQLGALLRRPPAAGVASTRTAVRQSDVLRIVVVGRALAKRLHGGLNRLPGDTALQCVGVFDSLADAVQAAPRGSGTVVDLLLWQAASLQPGAGHELLGAQRAWRAPAAAVVYRYSGSAARTELTRTGIEAMREPADDESLLRWLASLTAPALPAGDRDTAGESSPPVTDALADLPVAAPRFSEAALTEFAALPSGVTCECPSHLAGLILQITSFETYSGDCVNRSEDDAQLHAYMQRVAGAARMLFETALERVAVSEGLPLPASR